MFDFLSLLLVLDKLIDTYLAVYKVLEGGEEGMWLADPVIVRRKCHVRILGRREGSRRWPRQKN